jgi:hypothetical protein
MIDFSHGADYIWPMKIYPILAIVVAGFVAGGCGKSESTPSGGGGATSGGYVGALEKGQQTAVKTVDVASLNQNIQLFNAQEGRNPEDLDELVKQHYIPKVPDAPAGMKFVYDKAEGKVSLASQ